MSPGTRAELASQRDRARATADELFREATALTDRAEGKARTAQDLQEYASDLDVIIGAAVQAEVPS